MTKIKKYLLDGFAATVAIAESNGGGESVTNSISNSNMGDVDEVNLDPSSYPITAGNRSFAKYQRFNVSNMGGSTAIRNLKVWRTGALSGSSSHVTNARTTSYGGAIAYAAPVKIAVSGVDQAMPESEPVSANLGVSGALTGEITAQGFSDYLVHQIITDIDDTAGNSTTMNYQYDEVA